MTTQNKLRLVYVPLAIAAAAWMIWTMVDIWRLADPVEAERRVDLRLQDRLGEWEPVSADTDRDGRIDFRADLGWSRGGRRLAEFEADLDHDGHFEVYALHLGRGLLLLELDLDQDGTPDVRLEGSEARETWRRFLRSGRWTVAK